MMKRTVLAALIALATTPSQAKGILTGNDLDRACARYLNTASIANAEDGIEQGQCHRYGVRDLLTFGRALPVDERFCPPQGSNAGQAVRIWSKP